MELDDLDALNDDRRVLIFYSSDEQPEILDFYEEALQYLDEVGIENEIIDIAESTAEAQEYGVLTTPAVIVEDGETEEKYTGIMAGLKQLLQEDMYGKSVLHEAGFKRGRELATDEGLGGSTDEAAVMSVLEEFFAPGAVVVETTVDFAEQEAVVAIEPSDADGGEGAVIHEQFAAVLEGFFLEVFETNDASDEVKCVREGDERCEFEITGETAGEDTDEDQGA